VAPLSIVRRSVARSSPNLLAWDPPAVRRDGDVLASISHGTSFGCSTRIDAEQRLNRSRIDASVGKSWSNYSQSFWRKNNEQYSNPDGICLIALSLSSPVDSPALFTVVVDGPTEPSRVGLRPVGRLYVIACECSSFPLTQNSLRKS